MHIIVGILTAVAGLIWALYRLQNSGVDLNSFNPFYWARRRNWEKQLGTKPIHRLESPMEAAALLVVGMAGLDGEFTREQRNEIINLFVSEFGVSSQAAGEYFSVSSHMLKDIMDISAEVRHILSPSKSAYKSHHVESLLSMLATVSTSEGPATNEQVVLLETIKGEFNPSNKATHKW